ncbi:MAG: hypothetical protein F4106_09445 [Gemmatimonadetes bacterium]|nr:hypothetical protein [Gemmatimonadota bacterium]MYC91367.1 hypothetical protein [Gemmatimonadota bacterium]MYG36665.1 hypothetical protein [Gemmatimonadota bacterium]MYJ18250.1 hypothetical protein [Gemmatimonadota bacterium]
MAEMSSERFDELVEWVRREHLPDLDFYEGESGDGYAEDYWLTLEEHPDRAETEITALIECSQGPWKPGKGTIPPAMAWDAVWQIACRYIGDGQSMPKPLRHWTIWRLAGLNRHPRGPKAGPRKRGRDLMIRFAIQEVCERFDLPPTRNDEPAGESCCAAGGSACDVVGEAVGLRFKNTVRIWNERDPEF